MSVSWGRRLVSSVLAALATVVVTHAASVFVFFVSQQYQSAVITQVSDYYVLGSLFAIVFVFVFALVGGLRLWWTALLAGLFSGLLATLIGTGITTIAGGFALNGEVVQYLFGTLVSINGVYVVASTIIAATIGRAVYVRALGWKANRAEAGTRVALVRMPASNLADGVVTHIGRTSVDTDLADKQWDAYTKAFEEHGWTTREVPFADKLADSVFIEDALIVLGSVAVVTRSGVESRQDEAEGAEEAAQSLGLTIERIMNPGTIDGGDVLVVGTRVYVGRGGRTNAEGIRQLRSIAAAQGFDVTVAPVSKALHLKTAMTALPDGTLLGHPDLVDNPAFFPHFVAVPEKEGTNIVALDDRTVLVSQAAPLTAELIRELGYTVVSLDISEFEKLEGSLTCLSVRVQ
ncbi:dimethylargininase [Okibacterium sp. HSC-33S16]|uniref:dimethylargininase n=1 Tax=Okibacterium sp. HSC-33S16 TaxID=2910965 RepID=UPI00209DFE8C|nr:dimethylargininase [Okibacterium sp. HSC-33S16]MCP2030093.1 dimethylargininase [Okibacterium sp. HSC-33S16]